MTRIAQPSRDAPTSDWTVYADALQEANDPRGELIALNLAVAKGMSAADRDAYLVKHAAALFGPAAEHLAAFRVMWTGCLADTVEIRIHPGNTAEWIVASFLQSPLVAGTRAIELVGVPAGKGTVDLSAAVKLLVERWPEHVRSLALVDERATQTTMLASRDHDPPDNLVTFGDLAGIWGKLEHVRLAVADSHQLQLGAIDAPELRSFTLHCLRYGTYEGDAPVSAVLAKARWPKLTSLELRLPEEYGANIIDDAGAYLVYYANQENFEDRADEAESEGENYDGTNWNQLGPAIANLAKSPLERLALTSFDSEMSLLRTLAAAGLPPRLVELDLSESSVSSPDWFLEHKAHFHSIKRLVLKDVSMSEEDAAKLADLGPEIVHTTGRGAKYRYIVGWE